MSKVIALGLYPLPTPMRSSLVKHPPESVPPVDELESLQAELKTLRAKAAERKKKADEDARLLEESMRRLKERDREKKDGFKVKRERDYTPIPEVPKARDKKSKRKREQFEDDSDAEPRKSTPVPTVIQKAPQKHSPSVAVKTPVLTGQSHVPDFTAPTPSSQNPHALLPTRPVPVVPTPGPSKPTQVMDDFSKSKAPTQVAVSTFYSSIDPYIKNLREEDVGWLEWSGEEEECFVVPGLGRWYKDVWEDVDYALSHGLPPPPPNEQVPPPESFGAPEPTFDPSQLNDTDTQSENRGHGPLTERVISALLPHPDAKLNWKGVKAAEDSMEGRPGGSGAAAARKERMNVKEVEERVRDTMRYYGLLDDIPSFSSPVSDPITTALRLAQSQLRKTLATNKSRRQILINRARERLAYQEYVDARDSIDRAILNTYSKLQKKDLPKPPKKKRKEKAGSVAPSDPGSVRPDGVGDDGTPVPPVPTVPPAALGLVLDEDNRLVVPDSLKALVNVRKELATVVGSVFDSNSEGKNGGKKLLGGWKLPTTSVYEGAAGEVTRVPDPPPDVKMDVDPKV